MRVVFFLLVWVVIIFAKSEKWVVLLDDGVNAQTFAREHDLRYVGPWTRLSHKNYHVFIKNTEIDNSKLNARLAASTDVLWHEQQVLRQRFRRFTDPLYSQQWHLHGTFRASVDVEHDNNTGRGVTIAIVDDGLQHRHPEIQHNYDARHSWDYNENDADPTPLGTHGHGTSAAGVAAGVQNNNHCGVGVAPDAHLVGIRLIAGGVSDMTEAEALSHYPNIVDIYSCSWGPADSGQDMQGPARLTAETLAHYAGDQYGRNGKGSIYVWASGNGRGQQDSCAYDGFAGSPYVFAIGAVGTDATQTYYSEGCTNLVGVTPSSDRHRGITTADLMGTDGYETGECTQGFGGTSSATPLAAGIIARMLQKRPELTWRDVRHIIAKGATFIDTQDVGWTTNAGGYKHSNRYGFGLLKIPLLMQTLEAHALVPRQIGHTSNTKRAPSYNAWNIPNTSGESLRIPVPFVNTGIHFIEHVLLKTYVAHQYRGEVGIRIISPSGTTSTLTQRHEDRHQNYPASGWLFSVLTFWGETTADGTWQVEFLDWAGGNQYTGKVGWFELSVFGY